MDKLLVVKDPVANLRREPVDAQPAYVHDDLQETQVLFNEILTYRDENPAWFYVEAVEQAKCDGQGRWHGYPGWIHKEHIVFIEKRPEYNSVTSGKIVRVLSDPDAGATIIHTLSIGTRLEALDGTKNGYQQVRLPGGGTGWVLASAIRLKACTMDKAALAQTIIGTARLFLGVPYLWGGRSMHMPESRTLDPELPAFSGIATGVDCSGLTNLTYRANHIDIPRDAVDQWRKAEKITLADISPGDLLFLSGEGKPDAITHVMLYAGGDEFIEAAETNSNVRVNTFQNKIGVARTALREDYHDINNLRICCGRIIH